MSTKFVSEPGLPEVPRETISQSEKLARAQSALAPYHTTIISICGKSRYGDDTLYKRLVQSVADGNNAHDVVQAMLRSSDVV